MRTMSMMMEEGEEAAEVGLLKKISFLNLSFTLAYLHVMCGRGIDWIVLFLLSDLPGNGYVNNEYDDGGMEQDRSYGRGRGRGRGGRGGRGRGGYNGPSPYYEAQQDGGDYGYNAAPPADHGYDGPPPQGRGMMIIFIQYCFLIQ